jgi:two-component system OmpR family sensor kinase
MKRRLFWKILIGFWLTFFIISQGIWLMFTLLRPEAQDSAHISVAAAASALHMGGESGLKTALAAWPAEQRGLITVQPLASPAVPESRAPVAETVAVAPGGARYRIAYHARINRHRGLLGIPNEVLFVAAIGGLIFSAILAWYLTQPVERMRTGFGRLARGDFSTRLGPSMGGRRDEIADLAHDFDSMAAQLQELVAARDRLLADVSHELRTPLARLNLAIGLARQDPSRLAAALDRIGGEAVKLDEMVGELLTLAKLESGPHKAEGYFDLAEVARTVIADARYEATAKAVDVMLEIPDGECEWLVLGDGKLVSRAVENIVRNALRYAPENGHVVVRLRSEAGSFDLSVVDDGPGVPEEAMASLFKPFGLSADGSGFGLGLAIAQRAAAVHGGLITVRNRETGGLEMTLRLPAATLAG